MWRFIPRWRKKRNSPPPDAQPPAARLDAQTHARLMAEARFLVAQGARARDLLPGETPDGEPEIGDELPVSSGQKD